MCTFGVLGLSCETPAAPPDQAAGARTRQPENSKRAHFRAPALQTPPKFHVRTPRERKKIENCGGRREKKREILGPPPFGAPPFWAPLFLGLGLHPLGPHTLSSENSTSKNWPKSNWPKSKLAEVEIGRSRNWPKSKLAEVELAELEKKSWPKSKLAEVDRALPLLPSPKLTMFCFFFSFSPSLLPSGRERKEQNLRREREQKSVSESDFTAS